MHGNIQRQIRTFIFLTGLTASYAASSFAGIVVDGILNDWGVTPFTDWIPDSATAYFTEEDNYNRPGSDPFREFYDIEAMYFDSDEDNLYFAVVSSNPYNQGWGKEDIALDFDRDGIYEFGLDVANLRVDYTSQKGVYQVDRWKTYRGLEYQIDLDYATQIGTYLLHNKSYSHIEGNHPWQKWNYVIEGMVSRSLFDVYANIQCGSGLKMQFIRITCVKDWITTEGNMTDTCPAVDPPSPEIPEPSTLILLFTGLFALGGMRLLKKTNKP